jgi:hypothetical protein
VRRLVAQVVLIVVGLAIVLYPLTLGADDGLVCRGVPMRPGDVCAKAGGVGVQTYEQRAGASRDARPIIVGVGVLVIAFGAGLLVTERRRVTLR